MQLLLNGESTLEVAAHSDYADAGVLARRGEEDLSAQVVTEGSVDTAKPGTYTVTYRLTVRDKEYVQQRTVTVVPAATSRVRKPTPAPSMTPSTATASATSWAPAPANAGA